MKLLFAVCTSILLLIVALHAQGPPSPPTDKLTEINATLKTLEDQGFSGAVLLAKDGKPVLRRGIGPMDRSAAVPMTPEIGFDIGSITKVFTSAAIFRLEQEGKLRLSDPVSKYFRNAPADKSNITILQLVTHSSGMADLLGENGIWIKDYTGDYDYTPVTRDEIVHRAFQSKLLFDPGTSNKYSNTGYSILAAIIEVASGQSYEKYVHDKILKPAGMEKTGYMIPKWKKQELAVGYSKGVSWGTPLDHKWLADGPSWNLRGNGGMISTVDDLLKWSAALKNDRVLGPREREAFFDAMNVKKNKRGVRTMGAAGSNDVFSSVFLWVLDEDRLIVIFSNQSQFAAEKYAGNIAGMMLRSGL